MNVEAPEEAKDDVVMLYDLAAPLDEHARAIGVQVLRAAAARAAAHAAPAAWWFCLGCAATCAARRGSCCHCFRILRSPRPTRSSNCSASAVLCRPQSTVMD